MIQPLERPRLKRELPHHRETSGRVRLAELILLGIPESELAGGVRGSIAHGVASAAEVVDKMEDNMVLADP